MSNAPRWLIVVAIFQAGVIVGLLGSKWNAPEVDPLAPRVAHAQAQNLPDPAGQQIITNEILRGMDAKLTRIADTLAGSEVKVKVTNFPGK
jgi:hypothetical protein